MSRANLVADLEFRRPEDVDWEVNLKVAVIGGSGYAGAELVRLVLGHPRLELTYVTSTRHEGKRLSSLYPNLSKQTTLTYERFSAAESVEKAELFLVALPHGRSMDIIPQILEGASGVVDLGGDFRLSDAQMYKDWYGFSHINPDYLGKAVYGLPEINREAIAKASLVANPGCYPTSVILALAPLAKGGHIGLEAVLVDSKSGISGAGRQAKPHLHFPAVNENLSAYSVSGHQHIPEMEEQLSVLGDSLVKITFVPHLVPMTRGVFSTVYLERPGNMTVEELVQLYEDFYSGAPFVNVLEGGCLPGTKDVTGSNYCHLGLSVDARTGKVVILSVLDNLVKGAAGQAIQNLNLMAGFDEEEGLKGIAVHP